MVAAPIRLRSSVCVLAPQDPHSIPLLCNIFRNVQIKNYTNTTFVQQTSLVACWVASNSHMIVHNIHKWNVHCQRLRKKSACPCQPFHLFCLFKTAMRTAIFSILCLKLTCCDAFYLLVFLDHQIFRVASECPNSTLLNPQLQ